MSNTFHYSFLPMACCFVFIYSKSKFKNIAQKNNHVCIFGIGGKSKRRKNTKAKSVFILLLRMGRICHWGHWFSWQRGGR